MTSTLETDERVVVRGLNPEDMEHVVALDAKITGRRREEFFRVKLQQNLAETGITAPHSTAGAPSGCPCT